MAEFPGRKNFKKVESSENPSRMGMINTPDSKTQPAQPNDGTGNWNGTINVPFREDMKVTKPIGSNGSYQDFGGGTSNNYSQKDKNMDELQARNKQGNIVQRWTATDRQSISYQGEGPTAYNISPIPETYTPATSNGVPDANAVEYNTDKKNRGPK